MPKTKHTIRYFSTSIRVYDVGPDHVYDVTNPNRPVWFCARSEWATKVAYWDRSRA